MFNLFSPKRRLTFPKIGETPMYQSYSGPTEHNPFRKQDKVAQLEVEVEDLKKELKEKSADAERYRQMVFEKRKKRLGALVPILCILLYAIGMGMSYAYFEKGDSSSSIKYRKDVDNMTFTVSCMVWPLTVPATFFYRLVK